MNASRERQARAILAYPRNYYAAQDGIELAETMLKLWDEFAREYPEIVEATQYFSAPVRPESMAVRPVDRDPAGAEWPLYLSPDGKHLLYIHPSQLRTEAGERTLEEEIAEKHRERYPERYAD